jgi:hypothetical protein
MPVLDMPILYSPLSHQTFGIVCICYLSLCSISLLRNILILLLLLFTLLVHNFRSPSHIQASKVTPSFRRPNLCNGERALLCRTHFIIYLFIQPQMRYRYMTQLQRPSKKQSMYKEVAFFMFYCTINCNTIIQYKPTERTVSKIIF